MRRENKIKGGLVQLESLGEWSTIIEVVFYAHSMDVQSHYMAHAGFG